MHDNKVVRLLNSPHHTTPLCACLWCRLWCPCLCSTAWLPTSCCCPTHSSMTMRCAAARVGGGACLPACLAPGRTGLVQPVGRMACICLLTLVAGWLPLPGCVQTALRRRRCSWGRRRRPRWPRGPAGCARRSTLSAGCFSWTQHTWRRPGRRVRGAQAALVAACVQWVRAPRRADAARPAAWPLGLLC